MMFKFSVLKLKDFIKNYKKEHLILFLFYIIFIIFLYYFCNYDLPEIIIGYFNITLKADPLISICNLSLFLLSCKLKVLSVFILPLVYLYYNYITIPIYSLILLNLFVVYILYLNKNSLLVN